MLKHLIILAALSATAAFAATPPPPVVQPSGIVTPDVARAFREFQQWNYDTNGDLVVCPIGDRYTECKHAGKFAWIRVQDAVPAGRAYVGFRISNGEYGRRWLEVYWK